jgi:hypothetical protein
MKLGRLNHIGIAAPSIADNLAVIASVVKQSSSMVGIVLDCRVALLLAMTGWRQMVLGSRAPLAMTGVR